MVKQDVLFARELVTACGKKAHVVLPKRYIGRTCDIYIGDKDFDMLMAAVQGFDKIIEYFSRKKIRCDAIDDEMHLRDILHLDAPKQGDEVKE